MIPPQTIGQRGNRVEDYARLRLQAYDLILRFRPFAQSSVKFTIRDFRSELLSYYCHNFIRI